MQQEPVKSQADQLADVEQLLAHFEHIETQFRQVRDALTHSHRLATLGTIASIVAHEYNNILTPVVNYAQLALDKPGDAELVKKALERTIAGCERAAKISSSLLGFACEANDTKAAHLGDTIRETISCLGRDPRKDGITLMVDVPDVRIAMSSLNLQQVLLNLVLNACKVMRPSVGRAGAGGLLRITGRAEEGCVYVDVADTGPGIPEEIRDRLFEPFVTRNTDPTDTSGTRRGTGLGLCICRDLIQNAGGTISVDSVAGKGATFHLCLPLVAEPYEST